MTDRIKTALVTGGAKRIGRAIVEDLAANGFAVAIHCNRSADEGAALAEEIALRRRQGDRGRGRSHRHERRSRRWSSAHPPNSGLSACWSTAPRSSGTMAPIDLDLAVLDRHFDIHLRAPVLLAGKLAAALAGGRRGAGRQHHRPARLAADAALFQLHAVEVGAVDGHANAGAGVGAQSARQRHRPRADAAKRPPAAGGLRRAGRRAAAQARAASLANSARRYDISGRRARSPAR